jgi:hypothetical protein
MKPVKLGVRWAALPLVALLSLAACEDPAEVEVPEATMIRLVAAGQTVDITTDGASRSLNLVRGNNTVTATFFRDNGNELQLGTNDFEIRLTPANTGVATFTRTGAFAGTLAGVATGSTQVSVELFHKIDQHAHLGPVQVTVNVP